MNIPENAEDAGLRIRYCTLDFDKPERSRLELDGEGPNEVTTWHNGRPFTWRRMRMRFQRQEVLTLYRLTRGLSR